MGLVHSHLLIRAEVRKPFTKPESVKVWLKDLVEAIGMKICESGGPHVDYVDKPDNHGIAGIVMIETSHCSIHVWDRLDIPLVQMDVYSCAPFNARVVEKFLYEMDPIRIKTRLFDRGESFEIREEMDWEVSQKSMLDF